MTIWTSNFTPGHISGETLIQKDTCTPMFVVALFTAVKIWKQSKYPLTDERVKKMWYTHTQNTHTVGYYSDIKEEWNDVICSNVDEPRVLSHRAK